MFASLKNKIKEETGSDLTNLTPILNNPPLKLYKGRHSRQGSGSSIGSVSDSVTDDGPPSPTSSRRQDLFDVKLAEGKALTAKDIKRFEKREDEWRRKMQKKDEEWSKRTEKREEEFKKQMEEQQKEWERSLDLLEKEKSVLEDEKREVVKQKLSLEEALKVAEEYKKKVFQYQEDIDQLEGFQTQEMAKIKHLLLVTEQELTEKSEVLKDSLCQIETLRSEVNRMHRYEEELSNVQESSNTEKEDLCTRLREIEEHVKKLDEENNQLNNNLQKECEQNQQMESELKRVREELRSEQSRCAELQQSLSHERQDKDSILLRNAQVSQEVQLVQQAAREQQREHTELLSRVAHLEEELSSRNKEIEKRSVERETLEKRIQELELVQHNKQAAADVEERLRKNICDLEEQMSEKNKTVRILQQRLADMKKTLQRELRGPSSSSEMAISHHDNTDGFHGLSSSGTPTANPGRSLRATASSNDLPKGEETDDIKLKYLKHVLIKFLTSREYEAQHLTRAVATLLKFTPDEERLLRETLEWKMSWFGTRPSLGMGQTSKTIPPS